jgi:hypothetical protein
LGLQVVEVGEGAKGPEVVSDIVDAAFFHFAFFLRLPHVTSHRGDLKGPQKLQELLVEPHQGSVMFNDGGEHVVMDSLFGRALEKAKGPKETAVQRLLPLRVGKFEYNRRL